MTDTNPAQPSKTAAQEAMEPIIHLTADYCDGLDDFDKAGFFDEIVLHRDQIMAALALLDHVQSGKAKVLEREPTDEMSMVGQIISIPYGADLIYKAMWDAAPLPQADGEV